MAAVQRLLADDHRASPRSRLQPAAGAHGELTGLLLIRAYHRSRGEGEKRRRVIVPDSAHGTNPASVSLVGYETVVIPSGPDATVDLEALREGAGRPHGGGDAHRPEHARSVRAAGARGDRGWRTRPGRQCYMDGANLNALVGRVRPGDLGFDVMHINLHKTFSTPHGGGGPGAGPVAVARHLEPFLPVPVAAVRAATGGLRLDWERPQSIGRVHSFNGNFGILRARAYAYMLTLGPRGARAR